MLQHLDQGSAALADTDVGRASGVVNAGLLRLDIGYEADRAASIIHGAESAAIIFEPVQANLVPKASPNFSATTHPVAWSPP